MHVLHGIDAADCALPMRSAAARRGLTLHPDLCQSGAVVRPLTPSEQARMHAEVARLRRGGIHSEDLMTGRTPCRKVYLFPFLQL